MDRPVDMRRVLIQTRNAAHRRRRRLLSARENGAIIEQGSLSFSLTASPPRRIPVPPRHTLTRPWLIGYYKIATGKKPPLMHGDPRHEEYNYSWFTPSCIESKGEVSKCQHRLQKALLVSRMPLDSLNDDTKGIFDSGHLHSPIFRQLQCKAKGNLGIEGMYDPISESFSTDHEGVANSSFILVQPVSRELPSEERMVREELTRVAPKGREWDRQHALRQNIGVTAQEAIIDRCIDTRYRHPGDYVRRSKRGEPVDARGRPVRAVTTTTSKE